MIPGQLIPALVAAVTIVSLSEAIPASGSDSAPPPAAMLLFTAGGHGEISPCG